MVSYGLAIAQYKGAALDLWVIIGLYTLALFVVCMVCHGEMVRLKPSPRYLTRFYLMLSTGGALGGLFVGVLAPLIFTDYIELHVGILGGWGVMVIALAGGSSRWMSGRRRWPAWSGLLLLVAVLVQLLWLGTTNRNQSVVARYRGFYGVVSVMDGIEEGEPVWSLRHGNIIHGAQFRGARRDRPLTYFTPVSGLGLVLESYRRGSAGDTGDRPLRVGDVGLGVGSIAAYGRKGDTYRFYEINPQVVELAQGKGGFFSFLKDCQARVEVIEGDGRTQLEDELRDGQPQDFDVLVIDAFSGDSLPMHLATLEAFKIYLRHLRPAGGVLAVHISNRFLDLRQVVWKLASVLGLEAVLVPSEFGEGYAVGALWMLLSPTPGRVRTGELLVHSDPCPFRIEDLPLWTDDSSNLFGVMR
jgi:hypothetical protein